MAMTDRDKKVMAAVLGLLLLAGLWFLMIQPKRTALADANQHKTEAQAALDTAKATEAAARAVKHEKPQSYAKIVQLGAAVPADPDFESLLVQVNSIAEKSKVSFENLSVSTAASSGGVTEGTSGTTCDAPGASPATGATPAAGSTGATGSTSQTWVGSSIEKANGAAATANSTNQQAQSANAELSCNAAPTLADLSAQAAGLTTYQYTLLFKGEFFKLSDVLGRVLDMVRVTNGRVAVSGRLLDIKQMTYNVDGTKQPPLLTANVQLTAYSMPVGTPAASAAPAATPATGTPAASSTPAG